MKSIVFILAVVALSFTSCKKDYTCECIKNSPNGESSESYNTGKMKLDEARAKCNDGDKSETVLGQSYTTECTLK